MDRRSERFQRRLARAIEPYRTQLADLVSGRLSPGDFEIEYMRIWGDDERWIEGPIFRVVEGFFFAVEDYVDNPALRDPAKGDLGPEELKDRARELLRRAGFEPPFPA